MKKAAFANDRTVSAEMRRAAPPPVPRDPGGFWTRKLRKAFIHGKAPRGASVVSTKTPDHERPPALVSSRTLNEKRSSALKAAQQRDESDFDEYLERQAQHHPDPATRQRANAVLEKRAKASR